MMEQRVDCVARRLAGPVNEGDKEDGSTELTAHGAAESRTRYQVRSKSMPFLEPSGEFSTTRTVNATLPLESWACQELRLPSFKALGIAVPHPDHLLTPPDEPDQIAWHPLSQPLPQRQDYETLQDLSRPTERMTPEDDPTLAAPLDSEGVEPDSNTASGPQSLDILEEDPVIRSNSSSSEGESPGGPVWLGSAIDAVGKPRTATSGFGFHSANSQSVRNTCEWLYK